ncbi:MAG: hypothetical protein DCC65_08425 [Planctomycetota bacterium]|nr:MAG: hypothetical protein DCC65_08425 [Planctomycetota bacterium]
MLLNTLVGGWEFFFDHVNDQIQLFNSNSGQPSFATGQLALPMNAGFITAEVRFLSTTGGTASLSFAESILWAASESTPANEWIPIAVPISNLAGTTGALTFAIYPGSLRGAGDELLIRNMRLFDNTVPASAAGDVNLDGSLNGLDVQAFVNVLLGVDTDPVKVFEADMDGSGTVDEADVLPFVSSLLNA